MGQFFVEGSENSVYGFNGLCGVVGPAKRLQDAIGE